MHGCARRPSRLRTVIILGEGLVAWAELGLVGEGLRMREAVSNPPLCACAPRVMHRFPVTEAEFELHLK